MFYTPKYHHRRSIRLQVYDYAQAGLYFITICCNRRGNPAGWGNPAWLPFGNIENGVMHLNDAGRMVEKWYYELENKYPDKRCHEMVVMPNHIHFIIENVAMDETNRDGRDETGDDGPAMGAHVGAPLRGRPVPATIERGRPVTETTDNHITSPYGPDNKIYGATIGDAMGWFKTMTTNEYIRGVKTLGWPPFNKKLWQRNYYEHIIRNHQSYERISVYIKNNPEKWLDDKFYQK